MSYFRSFTRITVRTLGIGGGIYLVPLIILFGLGNPKQAAPVALFLFGSIQIDQLK